MGIVGDLGYHNTGMIPHVLNSREESLLCVFLKIIMKVLEYHFTLCLNIQCSIVFIVYFCDSWLDKPIAFKFWRPQR